MALYVLSLSVVAEKYPRTQWLDTDPDMKWIVDDKLNDEAIVELLEELEALKEIAKDDGADPDDEEPGDRDDDGRDDGGQGPHGHSADEPPPSKRRRR